MRDMPPSPTKERLNHDRRALVRSSSINRCMMGALLPLGACFSACGDAGHPDPSTGVAPVCPGNAKLPALRYTAPGCGANAPAPTCGGSNMDACLAGYLCLCDGTLEATCQGWSTKPWAYALPGAWQSISLPATCDPTRMPDGGTR